MRTYYLSLEIMVAMKQVRDYLTGLFQGSGNGELQYRYYSVLMIDVLSPLGRISYLLFLLIVNIMRKSHVGGFFRILFSYIF